ncbi:MAG: hypothetical protein OXF51_06705 [Alphaproteobacteria bacterium]|nr:hypothetical protein [Alphaproteobacteria bacterium]
MTGTVHQNNRTNCIAPLVRSQALKSMVEAGISLDDARGMVGL